MGNRSISEVAFDLWVEEDGLLDRLSLAAPERHDPGAQCWRYAGTNLDHQRRKVVHTFSRGVGVQEWSFNPWEGDRPDFEPVLEGTIHTLRIKANEAWRSASDALDAAVADGRVMISGRVGSPLNEPQSIPSSAWAFVDVDDWTSRTGEGQGIGEIYDLREAIVDSTGEPADAKVGRLEALVRAELAVMHPKGIPDSLTDAQLHWDVSKHLEGKGIERKVSLDTVKRAADRRKRK